MSELSPKAKNLVDNKNGSWLDRTVGKVISRKLTVFLVGTFFFGMGLGLTPDHWMTLAVAYVGTQGFIDSIVAYRETEK